MSYSRPWLGHYMISNTWTETLWTQLKNYEFWNTLAHKGFRKGVCTWSLSSFCDMIVVIVALGNLFFRHSVSLTKFPTYVTEYGRRGCYIPALFNLNECVFFSCNNGGLMIPFPIVLWDGKQKYRPVGHWVAEKAFVFRLWCTCVHTWVN